MLNLLLLGVSQKSYPCWLLGALNMALQRRVLIINLSVGGPDFTDTPFVEKVRQLFIFLQYEYT